MPEGPLDRGALGRYVALAQVGIEMVAPVGIGAALDHYLGWHPWGIVGGAVFGLVGGLAHLVALASRHENGGSAKTRRDRS